MLSLTAWGGSRLPASLALGLVADKSKEPVACSPRRTPRYCKGGSPTKWVCGSNTFAKPLQSVLLLEQPERL
jgi:hypothetical protein